MPAVRDALGAVRVADEPGFIRYPRGVDTADEAAVEEVAERDRDQPAGEGEVEDLGGVDAPDVAGAGADRAQDADLADAFEHAHRQGVGEAGHADRDDQEREHGDRRAGDVTSLWQGSAFSEGGALSGASVRRGPIRGPI